MKKLFLIIFFLVFIFGVFYFTNQCYTSLQVTKQQRILIERRKNAWDNLKHKLTVEIGKFNGEAGIVIKDLQVNWEFSFNKDKLFSSASLAKIPIMAACFRAAEGGRLKLNRSIKLKSADKLSGSGKLKNMQPGTEFSVEELIGLMIFDSDNTATNILTNIIGIDYLDNSFKVFGLENSNLSRKVADFHSRNKGIENYTTAEDMALILEKIYQRSLMSKNLSEKCLKLMKLQRINDRIPKYLPTDITIAHKTGLERGICHDAGIVFTCKGNFLICVLTKHKNSNSIPSKEFIAKVALYTYNYFEAL